MSSDSTPVPDANDAHCVLAYDLGRDPDDPSLRRIDDDYVQRYAALSVAAHRRGALSDIERELLWIAVFASAHLQDTVAVHLHTQRALAAGATQSQILSLRVETLGAHTMSFAVPMLLEELATSGATQHAGQPLTYAQEAVKRELIELRGWWNEGWLPLLHVDPGFLLATHRLLASQDEPLGPKIRELIYVALDVSTAHLYPAGARAHMRNALALGATQDQILEVLELVALVSYRSLLLLVDALDATGAPATELTPPSVGGARP